MNLDKDGKLTQGRYKGCPVSACTDSYLMWLMKQPRGIARVVQDAAGLIYARRLSGNADMTPEEVRRFMIDKLIEEVRKVQALPMPPLPDVSGMLWQKFGDRLDKLASQQEENTNHE